jgi:hypothetical protein
MTNATSPARAIDGIPRDLPAAMRAELPGVADEIIREIRRASPEYARVMDGPYGQALQIGILQCLTTFVDLIADPSAPRDSRDKICRRFGQYEAGEGRSLDLLHAVYRLGCQVAWRRIMTLCQRDNLDSAVVSLLADALFTYMDELAALSVEGYQAAQARSGDARDESRRRLLRLLLEQPPAPRRAIARLAELADWTLPETVTPVALRGPADEACALPDDDILANVTCAEPHLLVPGEVTQALERALTGAVTGRAAIGLTVPLAEVADSLRWARQALSLAESGFITETAPVMIPVRSLVRCEDYLVTLWLRSDPALAEQIVRRQLGVLEGLTARQRSRYTETLGAWLETRCTAAEIAQALHLHPQTVRYRIRQFEQAFGEKLKDPDTRFGIELALRFTRLGQRAPRQGDRRHDR